MVTGLINPEISIFRLRNEGLLRHFSPPPAHVIFKEIQVFSRNFIQQFSVPTHASRLAADALQAVHNTPNPFIYPLRPLSLLVPTQNFLSRAGRNIPFIAMGMCTSCEATTVSPITTAKLVLFNGELREFACPVKAAHVLQKEAEFFVCDADEMEFGGFVSAVPDDVELRLGQIYFVLPRSMLRQPLQAADLAALAVKASSAIKRAAPGGEKPLVFSETRSELAETTSGRRRRRRSGGSGRSFESSLCSILE